MLKDYRVHLNLASHPLRNRKLFYLSVMGLGIIFLLLAFISTSFFVSYRNKSSAIEASQLKPQSMI